LSAAEQRGGTTHLAKCRTLSDPADARLLDVAETVSVHIRFKRYPLFWLIKYQFDFKKSLFQEMAKGLCRLLMLAALINSIPALASNAGTILYQY
jgi:hypothetical protein